MKDTVIITGATRGLGQALVKVFAQSGHTCIINGRDNEALTETVVKFCNQCFAVPGDLRDQKTLDHIASCAEGHEAGILINNAGMYLNQPFDEINPDELREMIDVNLLAPMLLAQKVVPMMKRIGGGTIVNINSLAITAPSAGETVYAATKGGLRAFGEALNREVAQDHIQVFDVILGAMDTPMQLGRTSFDLCIDPIEVAQTIYELATAEKRTMRVTEIEIRRSRY